MDETYFHISGNLNPEVAAHDNCEISLHDASNDVEIARRDVDTDFNVEFVIGRYDKDFYAKIFCEGFDEYRSATLSTRKDFEFGSTFELGDVVMRPESNP